MVKFGHHLVSVNSASIAERMGDVHRLTIQYMYLPLSSVLAEQPSGARVGRCLHQLQAAQEAAERH